MEERSEWLKPELLARDAMSFYEKFYDIYVSLEKDGENLELLAADGHFQWEGDSEVDGKVLIQHPILLKRVELSFDPEKPQFIISDTDRDSELYSGLFVGLNHILPDAIPKRKKDLEGSGYHPWGKEDTTKFLKAFIQTISPTDGEFLEEPSTEAISPTPRLWRDIVLVLRHRNTGIANTVDAIIKDIAQQDHFSPALLSITGSLDDCNPETLTDSGNSSVGQNAGHTPSVAPDAQEINEEDILLALSANEEQRQIIRKLEKSGSVIVQGPPGTGKTHTIGNLIGHLLAEGKSILVTAQTSKALRVLRDKVPEKLQPLTVSVLGSDQLAREQLKASIESIMERRTSNSVETLQNSALNYESERHELLEKKQHLDQDLRQALENEYREIKCGSSSFSPSEAAQYVQKHGNADGWIPSKIKLGADLTLTSQEIARLYWLGTTFSIEEEADARKSLPDLQVLPNERQFKVMATEYNGLVTTDLSTGRNRWIRTNEQRSESLSALSAELELEFSDELRRQSWRPFAIVAGIHGGTELAVWKKLIEHIEATAESQSEYSLQLHHRPSISESAPIHQQHRIAGEILEHLNNGGKIGFLQRATKPEWWQFIKASSVSAGQPDHLDHFKALQALTKLKINRISLQMPWDELIGSHSQQPFSSLGATPEQACRVLIPEIRRCLNWHDSIWTPLVARLRAEGLKLDELMASIPREASQVTEYRVLETLATVTLPPLLSAELGRRRLAESEEGFAQLEHLAATVDSDMPEAGCIGLIIQALRDRHAEKYRIGLEYARRLHAIKPLVKERDDLLERLRLVAPAWSRQIANRSEPHHLDIPPGEINSAWIWRQLNDELLERNALNPSDVQREIDTITDTLSERTIELIDARAWSRQLEKLKRNISLERSLAGWMATQRLLISTKQPKERQDLLAESRKLMKKCAGAVPVWVMPISIVAESFDPCSTRFDVVIIDEASQADINALIPVYLGKKVIVVGDDEQVTPLGAGQNTNTLNNLRQQILTDIPHAHLYNSKYSIYDIGQQFFGDGIMLREHFRCVPEIIAFSNQLSYRGKIRPLRESSSSALKPACVSCHLPSGMRNGDINEAEARRIVDLIKAMLLHPLYAGKTIGVISMVGSAQGLVIQSLIHKKIPDSEIMKRRILVGNSSEFQGDERDVMFLSMVDSPDQEGPMRLIRDGAFEQTKKRYNVAASRAQDQMWVIHSFDPDLHLKTDDLRLKLLQHVRDPFAAIRTFEEAAQRTESPFERAVLKRLVDAGYQVKTQWRAGYYRIDMVVVGGGKRLAIECDGDRYHPIEKLADDIERQAILERVGKWQFARIRGSAFYRDPDKAMEPLFNRLEEIGISKEGDENVAEMLDMSLVHELDEIIANGFASEHVDETDCESSLSDDSLDTAIADDELETTEFPLEENTAMRLDGSGTSVGVADPETLLRQMGGTAQLETFLREFAKKRGYQRLGKNVRRQLMTELKRYAQKDLMVITDEIIKLAPRL